MAVLYATGWEAGTWAWYQNSSAAWAGLTFGQFGGASNFQHRTAGGLGGTYAVNPAWGISCLAGTVVAGTARWLHFWMTPNNPGISQHCAQFGRSGTAQVNVLFRNNGVIELFRGGTSLTSFVAAWSTTVSHWVAIEVVAANVGGIINVWVDGVLKASYTGDTQEHATLADWDSFGFGFNFAPSPGISSDGWVDDIIVTDNITGRVAEHYFSTITPDGDSAPLTLTPSTGLTHFNLVNEIPANDTTYNGTAVSGNEDLYTMSNPFASASILTVNVCARATRDGALTNGEISVKSGATTVYSAVTLLPASPSYLGIQHLLDTDPDTGVAWTSGGVNAMEAGFRITT